MNEHRTTTGILSNAEDMLATARAGLKDLTGSSPERRLPGLHNVIVFGRAVTNVLQGLRSTEPGFEDWYARQVLVMRNDPLLRFVYRLRSKILKQGTTPTTVRLHIQDLSFPRDMVRFGPPPPNAGDFFIGDQNGGTGWEIPLPDGEVLKYYVALPGAIGNVEVHLQGAPTEHLGAPLPDSRIETVGLAYISYLDGLLCDARREFAGRSGD